MNWFQNLERQQEKEDGAWSMPRSMVSASEKGIFIQHGRATIHTESLMRIKTDNIRIEEIIGYRIGGQEGLGPFNHLSEADTENLLGELRNRLLSE